MQAFYNLTHDELRAAVASCTSPLRVATAADMFIYVGVNENNREMILVKTSEANVLLTNGDKPYPETKSGPAPQHPWVFSIESNSHLVREAKTSTCASLGGISLAFGEDHAGEWFVTVDIMEETFFLFRLPDDEGLEPWSSRVAQPVLPGLLGTGDAELDWLLAALDAPDPKGEEKPSEIASV